MTTFFSNLGKINKTIDGKIDPLQLETKMIPEHRLLEAGFSFFFFLTQDSTIRLYLDEKHIPLAGTQCSLNDS